MEKKGISLIENFPLEISLTTFSNSSHIYVSVVFSLNLILLMYSFLFALYFVHSFLFFFSFHSILITPLIYDRSYTE